MRKLLFAIALLFPLLAQAQEQYIRACQTSYACNLASNVSWGAGVQTYVFTPMSPDVSLRINVHNQNTTQARTGTITLWITSSTTANFSLINNADRWVQAAITENTTANASCIALAANNPTNPGASGQGTCYAQGMYAAQIAIQFTPGGKAGGGSPDLFDIDIVQCTSSHCNYPGGPQPGQDSTAGASPGTTIVTGPVAIGVLAPCLTLTAGQGASFSLSGISSGTVNVFGFPSAAIIGFGLFYVVQFVDPENPTQVISSAAASKVYNLLLVSGTNTVCVEGAAGLNAGVTATLTSNSVSINNLPYSYLSSGNLPTQPCSNSALNETTFTLPCATLTEKGPRWSLSSNPGTGVQATVTRAAGGGTVRHVIDCWSFDFQDVVAAAAASNTVLVRDGASGVGTIIWQVGVSFPTGIGNGQNYSVCGLNIPGSANTAMTCEFSSAGTADTAETIACSGYDTQ